MENIDHLKKIELGQLHPFEAWLLLQFRTKYRFGEITVVIQDGIPQRIKVAVIKADPRDKLNNQEDDNNT